VSERAKQARNIPHILITTPESLAIILTTPVFIASLRALEFIVVDEIHALTNKRGVFLSLTLERLCHYSLIDPVRIGLSATVAPLERIAAFLGGVGREVGIAAVPLQKGIDISLVFPGTNILESEETQSAHSLYQLLDQLIAGNRTTLIFTNTRNATEKLVHHLEQTFPGKYSGMIGAHHSSMSKETRFAIEERLRRGELKVIVSSTSLELGIDIGSIDLVILLRSPKAVSRALQRVGRAGHQLHAQPKGVLVVTDRDDLLECAVLMKEMKEKHIDQASIPENALDVLAQHIYGMAISKIWDRDEMLRVIRTSYCYRSLSQDDFLSVISYLAGDYALEHRHVYAKIWYDEQTKQIGKKGKLARVIYLTNIGTIPSEGFIEVVVGAGEGRGLSVGKIDEGFLERMKRGDIFVLGGQKYQFLHSKGMKAFVRAGVTKNPTIPSWFSEQLPLSYDTACEIGRFLSLVGERITDSVGAIRFIQEHTYCSKQVAEEAYAYCLAQERFAALPTGKTLVIERFKEEKEFAVFHACYGRRVNEVLARAYAYAAGRLRMRDVEIGVHDHGFFLAGESLDIDTIMKQVKSENVKALLLEALERTDVLKRRFRHCAGRALMILRTYKGREKSVGKQQVHSEFLLSAVRKISNDFPILREARREVIEDFMDVAHAIEVLKGIENKTIQTRTVRTPFVSPFGLHLYLQGKSDIISLEHKLSFLKRMHQLHQKTIAGKGL
jgi:ATP-dependent Lhr-like helicase